MSGAGVWERFSLDPRVPQHAHMRASDRDRDVVRELLGTAYAEGRIDDGELDERIDRVGRAKTLGELPHVLADLVSTSGLTLSSSADLRTQAEQRYAAQRRQALRNFLAPTLICWAIWLLVSGFELDDLGFPWPVFVMLGTGMHWVRLATAREDSIESIRHGLEKRERKRAAEIEKAQRRAMPPGSSAYPPPPLGT
jgi:hypothetical protein